MAMRTIDCPDCGASVPYGRLSCPACGGLVASVAGAPSRPAESIPGPDLTPVAEPTLTAAPTPAAEPILTAEPTPAAEPAGPAEPFLVARPYERRVADETDPPVNASVPASGYRPPPLAFAATSAGAPSGSLSTATSAATDERASRSDVMDPVRIVELAGWFVIVGATMSLLGLLLPWSRVVIGAKGVGGYLDTWGLASPTHILVFVALLAVLAFGIVRNPLPVWLRVGVFGLALGSLLIGLVWPYVVGPLGADVGVLVVALGGSALIIGGVVALWATRHAAVEPFV